MLKRNFLLISLCCIPFLAFSQWTQIGSIFNGPPSEDFGRFQSGLSGDGTTLAIGTPLNNDNGDFSGYVEVYKLVGSDWVQKGERIEGITMDDTGTEGTGAAVDLNIDGNTLAVGISHGHNSLGYRCGLVDIYDWDGNTWVQRGATIEGEGNVIPIFQTDVFGSALDLSPDGNHIVVGARSNSPEVGVLQFSGHARVFSWDGNAWVQIGADIDGRNGMEEFGHSVSINDEGTVIAVGARGNNEVAQGAGAAYIFEWDGANWIQRGDTFFGTASGFRLGNAVSLDKIGNTVAIGTPQSANVNSDGRTQIFDWNGTAWIQRGGIIFGLPSSQSGSALDLSSDGNVIAIGEPWHNSVRGQVAIFEWIGSNWLGVDNAITLGTAGGINSTGRSVSLNTDGSVVAIGAPGVRDGGQIAVFSNETLVNIDDLSENIFQVFPNPTANDLKITSANLIEQVSLYNHWGQKLMEVKVEGLETNLDLSQLPSGNYFTIIHSNNKFKTVKITKI